MPNTFSEYTQQASDQALERLHKAIHLREAISFREGLVDQENKEVLWSLHGLIKTNEIVVVARYRNREFAIAHNSRLLYPVMADRVFGMDIGDEALSEELSHRLWALVEAAIESSLRD